MDSIELGKKIKEARIAKKMTQSEVVGDFITRNMLSQIESGSATPSVKTLVYLSRVLDIQLSDTFFASSENSLLLLIEAKEALINDNYVKLIALENDFPLQLFDEFCAIFSIAFLKYAQEMLDTANYQEAAAFAKKTIDYSAKGMYSNKTIKSEGIMILHAAADKLSEYYKKLSQN